jgi:hypothetical protein
MPVGVFVEDGLPGFVALVRRGVSLAVWPPVRVAFGREPEAFPGTREQGGGAAGHLRTSGGQ